MKRILLASIIILIAGVLFSGCFAQQFVAGSVDSPTMMSGAAAEKKEYTVVKNFSVSDRSGWFILGLIPSGHTDLNKIVADEVKSARGDAVINLKIKSLYDPADILIGILVGGIYNTRQSIITGDIIKYK